MSSDQRVGQTFFEHTTQLEYLVLRQFEAADISLESLVNLKQLVVGFEQLRILKSLKQFLMFSSFKAKIGTDSKNYALRSENFKIFGF